MVSKDMLHNVCWQDGCGRELLDGALIMPASTPGVTTPAHRTWQNNPFQDVIVRLTLAIRAGTLGHNALDDLFEVLRNEGGTSPFSALAVAHFPRSAKDVLFCASQTQASCRPGH